MGRGELTQRYRRLKQSQRCLNVRFSGVDCSGLQTSHTGGLEEVHITV
jgi:hypothetical protein